MKRSESSRESSNGNTNAFDTTTKTITTTTITTSTTVTTTVTTLITIVSSAFLHKNRVHHEYSLYSFASLLLRFCRWLRLSGCIFLSIVNVHNVFFSGSLCYSSPFLFVCWFVCCLFFFGFAKSAIIKFLASFL